MYPTTGGPIIQTASDAPERERALYLTKVYGLTFTGVATFFAATLIPIALAYMGSEAALAFCNFWAGLPWILNLVILMGGAWLASALAETRFINLVAFYMFSVFFGLISIGLVARAGNVGGVAILLQALGLTTLVFGSLTLFVFVTRKDFGFLGNFLFCGLVVLIGASLLAWVGSSFFGMEVSALSLALTIASTLLFMGYVLYDTSNILHRCPTTMVVPAALSLMIDFIMLFRNIVFLLMRSR